MSEQQHQHRVRSPKKPALHNTAPNINSSSCASSNSNSGVCLKLRGNANDTALPEAPVAAAAIDGDCTDAAVVGDAIALNNNNNNNNNNNSIRPRPGAPTPPDEDGEDAARVCEGLETTAPPAAPRRKRKKRRKSATAEAANTNTNNNNNNNINTKKGALAPASSSALAASIAPTPTPPAAYPTPPPAPLRPLDPPPTASLFTPEVSAVLCRLVEQEVLSCLMPSLSGLHRRRNQLRFVAEYITEAIRRASEGQQHPYGDVRYYIFGSVNMRTVLPDGDNDITIEVDGLLPPSAAEEDTNSVNANESGAADDAAAAGKYSGNSGGGGSSGQSINNNNTTTTNTNGVRLLPVTTDSSSGNCEGTMQLATSVDGKPFLAPPAAISIAASDLLGRVRDWLQNTKCPIYVDAFVNAEVRVLKLLLDGSSYDITIGQFGGINCVRFLHEMDAVIGGQHVLKRTLLLLKSWLSYEAHILGGQAGYIGSYAATVMLIAMLNTVEFLEDVDNPEATPEEQDAATAASRNGSARRIGDGLSPLVLFARFLKFYYYFDYDHYSVTAFGPLLLTEVSSTPLDLSKLEVPAAHSTPHPAAADYDVNFLGLTAEGQAAIGHLIRRRRRPLLTVSGVKHLLHEVNTQRRTEREARYARRMAGQPEPHAALPPADQTHVRLNRPGNVHEDVGLVCPSCTTAVFPVRPMNVLDPLRWSSNMVRGVCRNHLQRIRRAFHEGLRMLQHASAALEPGITSPSPPRSAQSVASSNRSSGDGGSGGPLMFPNSINMTAPGGGAAAMAFEDVSVVRGYPAPHSCRTQREVAVLQTLFGQTIAAIQKGSGQNCPWGRPQDVLQVPGIPRCAGCPQPSLMCAPEILRMCQPQHVSSAAPDSADDVVAKRMLGPLGELAVPPSRCSCPPQ